VESKVSFEPIGSRDSRMFTLCKKFIELNLRVVTNMEVMEMDVDSTQLYDIWKQMEVDSTLWYIERSTRRWEDPEDKAQYQGREVAWFLRGQSRVLWYKGRICVPNIKELKDKILQEAHESGYSIHPGGNKMYHDLRATYWWYRMKRDVAGYVTLLWHLWESQGWAWMTCWIVATFVSTWVEVGRYCYGFHHGIA
jgi:hypothetical protein